jgi:hypothetical protein
MLAAKGASMPTTTIWGWNSTNCWAGAIGAVVAAGMRLMLHGMAPSEASGLAELDWAPPELTILVAAILGGAAGMSGALLVDLLKLSDR